MVLMEMGGVRRARERYLIIFLILLLLSQSLFKACRIILIWRAIAHLITTGREFITHKLRKTTNHYIQCTNSQKRIMGISMVLDLVNPDAQHNLPKTCFGNRSLQEKQKKLLVQFLSPVSWGLRYLKQPRLSWRTKSTNSFQLSSTGFNTHSFSSYLSLGKNEIRICSSVVLCLLYGSCQQS